MPGKTKKSINRQWLYDHINDPYVKLAQKEAYRSRAAYKLKEIDDDLHLVKPGQMIIDLGAAPGSWSQYIQRKLQLQKESSQGRLVALDLLPMEAVPGVHFIQGDFREENIFNQLIATLENQKADLIVSDMAPNLSGVAAVDSVRMSILIELALELAKQHLSSKGVLIVKCFHGSGYSQLVQLFKQHFKKVFIKKPKASRDKSAETFLVGMQLK